MVSRKFTWKRRLAPTRSNKLTVEVITYAQEVRVGAVNEAFANEILQPPWSAISASTPLPTYAWLPVTTRKSQNERDANHLRFTHVCVFVCAQVCPQSLTSSNNTEWPVTNWP